MNERTKMVVLIALVVILVGVFVAFRFSGSGKRRSALRREAKTTPAAQEVVPERLPTAEEFGEVTEWLAPDSSVTSVSVPQDRIVFGLLEPASSEEASRATTSVPVIRPFVTAPPRLQGILSSAGAQVALIEGETYGVGDTVKNTRYKVVEIGTSIVTLQGDRGDEITLDLLK